MVAVSPVDIEIEQQLHWLHGQMQPLATALRQAAAEIQETGLCPDSQLIEQLSHFQQTFETVRLRALPESAAAADVTSIQELRLAWESSQILSTVRHRLNEIASLRHTDPSQQHLLAGCRAQCEQLQQEWRTATVDAVQSARNWLNSENSLTALWELVTNGPQLDDQRWADLHAVVLQAFGKELATAVARGRIVHSSG